MIRIVLTSFAVLSLLGLATAAGAQGSAPGATPTTAWKEVIGPNEAQEFADAEKLINQLQQKIAAQGDGKVRRGFHGKAHAGLAGELKVLHGIPAFARFGIFKTPRTYQVFGRFSNGVGAVASDRRPDVRGLALKVVGAEGPMLFAGTESDPCQDFLMTNQPVSLARNAAQFLAFAKASVSGGANTLPMLVRELGIKEATRIMGFVATRLLRPVKSLAVETFWSGGPIKLGPYAVKFNVQPAGGTDAEFRLFGGKDHLRNELKTRLKKGDVKYGFFVQFFVDETRTPIEDASIEWKESDAPSIKVAELTFRQRDLDSAAARAEEERIDHMAFNPWHAPSDLRPLGNIMRVRRAVYEASAKLRNAPVAPAKGAE